MRSHLSGLKKTASLAIAAVLVAGNLAGCAPGGSAPKTTEIPTEVPPPATPYVTPAPLSDEEAYDIEARYPVTEVAEGLVKPSSYKAVDGLGRTLSNGGSEYSSTLRTGTVPSSTQNGKFVGIFYSSWHQELSLSTGIRNVTQILATLESDEEREKATHDYNHKVWKGVGGYHFWDEPIYNYYSTTDRYVLRKQAELLADAGVDCIILDNTNGTYLWEASFTALFEVFGQARKEGVNAPCIVFMLPFGPGDNSNTQLRELYKKVYSQEKYKDLWFMWNGKPLILAYPDSLGRSGTDKEIRSFFTFKYNEATYFSTENSNDYWGWLSVYPQCVYRKPDGTVEEITVGVAQNADYKRNCITAMSGYNVMGRSYAKGDYSYTYKLGDGNVVTVDKNIANSKYYGINFQQQWDFALNNDPEFIFVTGWNEWVAIRSETWAGDKTLKNTMVDQFDTEHSRDCEPSLGEMRDYYYYQLCENIRRFKGVEDTVVPAAQKTIDIGGKISQWDDVGTTYTYVGSTTERSRKNGSKGYGGKTYKNNTARNDIAAVKVAYDDNFVYFYAECADVITASDGEGWMRLFLDTQAAGTDSWEGFEFVVNKVSPEGSRAVVERSKGGWNWEVAGGADIYVRRNIIQIRIERTVLGLGLGGKPAEFGYKWTDNNLIGDNEGEILNLYTDGEAAPGGRFEFVFRG
ncbi:MAG: hypothetical protein J5912_01100 [Clostridia bacterium]|nr:hypothetical protein [Clostridia bacterium]